MFAEGPTMTTVAPPCALCSFEYATHAAASLTAVSRLISCRWARRVLSGDIVACARVAAGAICAAVDVRGGAVCADALAAHASATTNETRVIIRTSCNMAG